MSADSLERGIRLFDAGDHYEAHELWEDSWRIAEPDSSQRHFLQGLIQCAAAAIQGGRGRWNGARNLIERATGHFDVVIARGGSSYMGVELEELSRAMREYVSERGACPLPRLGRAQ